jgi:hypothetical protein
MKDAEDCARYLAALRDNQERERFRVRFFPIERGEPKSWAAMPTALYAGAAGVIGSQLYVASRYFY